MIVDIRDLLDEVELSEVQLLERVGRRRLEARDADGTDSVDDDRRVRIDANPDAWGETVAIRFRVQVDTPEVAMHVAYGIAYTRTGSEDIPESVQEEFLNRVALMAVYPYLRVEIQQMARDLRVDEVVLPMIVAGQFNLRSDDDTGGGH